MNYFEHKRNIAMRVTNLCMNNRKEYVQFTWLQQITNVIIYIKFLFLFIRNNYYILLLQLPL